MMLSPLTMANMARTAAFATPDAKPSAGRAAIEVVEYACPVCRMRHDEEDDAEACCQGPEFQPGADEAALRCPVCGDECADTHVAANCCLWKDLGPAARWLIAAAVERGASW